MKKHYFKHKPELKYSNPPTSEIDTSILPETITDTFTFGSEICSESMFFEIDGSNVHKGVPVILSGDVAIINIKSQSPLHPIIYWYILHRMSVGQYLFIYEVVSDDLYIYKQYFTNAFEYIKTSSGFKIYKKIEHLLVEKEHGLDEWSFCIPTGPGDASSLNTLVNRILKFDIPKKEIILCGRPGSNFKYMEHVRIVGEDIPAPPIHITKKKNVLAQEAKYKNLCILHDRVLLPSNFYEAILEFGDNFPVCAFQSFIFIDYNGVQTRRYSDFGTLEPRAINTESINSNYVLTSMHLLDKSSFYYSNVKRYSKNQFITGSLYLTKKALWNNYPQNEKLYWSEYEDVEYGLRLSENGIPSIANPYSLTLSQKRRSLLVGYFSYPYEDNQGRIQLTKVNYLSLFIRKTPSVLDLTKEEAMNKMIAFSIKYNLNIQLDLKDSSLSRFKNIFHLINELRIVRTSDFAKQLLQDINNYLLHEQMLISDLDYVTKLFCNPYLSDIQIKNSLIRSLSVLRNQLYQSLFFKLYKNNHEKIKISQSHINNYLTLRNIRRNKTININIKDSCLKEVIYNFKGDLLEN